MTSLELLEKLKSGASKRTCKTLDAIYGVCSDIKLVGGYDYSIATIARLGQNRGVPSAQSILNQSGEKYRILINELKKEALPNAKKTIQNPDWISAIREPKHQLLVRSMQADNKRLKKQISEMLPPNTYIEVVDNKQIVSHNDDARFNEFERKAVDYLISELFLEKWKFKWSERGELVDENGRIVLKPGTLPALQKALKYL